MLCCFYYLASSVQNADQFENTTRIVVSCLIKIWFYVKTEFLKKSKRILTVSEQDYKFKGDVVIG